MTLRRLPALCVVLAALTGSATGARAQADLPAEIVQAATLNNDQIAQTSKFVQEWLPKLVSDDPADVKKGREHLLEPLKNAQTSVSFRQKYSEMLLAGVPPGGGLERLASSEKDAVAVNSLRIAGELATTEAANLLTAHLTDASPAVAFSAASGLGRTFGAISGASGVPAITSQGVLDLVNRLGQQVTSEKRPEVAGAAVRALIAATGIVRAGFEGARPAAFGTLCRSCSQRAQAAAKDPGRGWIADLPAMLWATTAVRDALEQNNPAVALTPNQLPDMPHGTVGVGAEFMGHMLSMGVKRINDLPPGESRVRDQCVDLANIAEQGLSIAVPALGGQYQPKGLASSLKSGTKQGDTQFVRDAIEVLSGLRGQGLGPFMEK